MRLRTLHVQIIFAQSGDQQTAEIFQCPVSNDLFLHRKISAMLKPNTKFILGILFFLPSAAFAAEGGEHVNAYVKGWLERHHTANVVVEPSGISLPDRKMGFSGDIYSANQKV